MGKYAHKTPRLRTINLELKDFSAYVEGEFIPEKVSLDFSFTIDMEDDYLLRIFVHMLHKYSVGSKEDIETVSLHHSDHLIDFHLDKSQDISSGFDVDYLSHLLGLSLVMIKGYYDNITRGNVLNEIPIPILNPTKLVQEKYKDIIKDGVLKFPEK